MDIQKVLFCVYSYRITKCRYWFPIFIPTISFFVLPSMYHFLVLEFQLLMYDLFLFIYQWCPELFLTLNHTATVTTAHRILARTSSVISFWLPCRFIWLASSSKDPSDVNVSYKKKLLQTLLTWSRYLYAAYSWDCLQLKLNIIKIYMCKIMNEWMNDFYCKMQHTCSINVMSNEFNI